eukprot:gnl/Chilomastix_cuspidata/3452.p1 GENE.gnl/Chilomastix_cuspidata/3452~~gnl/Chilomastix_cuspidata/3452.p1  ORF type:complete len:903 (-),score=84.45 gnl/Chilomastix_cuspidata/3452:526-3234(-)
MANRWLLQFYAILVKNAKTSLRSWCTTLFKIIGPTIGVLLTLCIRILFNTTATPDHPEVTTFSALETCSYGTEGICYNMAYAPNTTFTRNILTYLNDTSVPGILGANYSSTLAFASADDLYNDIANLNHRVLNAFAFSPTPNCDQLNLTIMYNATKASIFASTPEWTPLLGVYVLEALADICGADWAGTDTEIAAQFTFATKEYPIEIAEPNDEIYSICLSIFIFIALLIPFCLLVVEVISERESGIRQNLYQSGLEEGADMFAWFLSYLVVYALSIVVLLVVGTLLDFSMFTYSDPTALFVVFFVSSIGQTAFSMFVAAFFRTIKGAVVGMILILALMILFQLLMSLVGVLIPIVSDYEEYAWVEGIFDCLPFYPYSVLLSVVGADTSRTTSTVTGEVIEPEGFGWASIYNVWEQGEALGVTIVPNNFLLMLLAQTVGYLVLTWYLNFVIGKGHGKRSGFLFFLKPSFWSNTPYRIQRDPRTMKPTSTRKGVTDPMFDARLTGRDHFERCSIAESVWGGTEGCAITLAGLGKTYRSCCRPSVMAVRELWLNIPEYSCFALLGRNGAGKSTSVGMLTAQAKVTRGTAIVDGWDLRQETEMIRSFIGICPQFSIFFPKLTALEHVELMSLIRGSRIGAEGEGAGRDEAIDFLKKVGLGEAIHRRARALSGGMQRRLTVVMALAGSSSIVFLDEPTTGLDPVSAMAIWDLVSSEKRRRTFVLTTHSMEEAETLGDNIAVINYGSVLCVGSSIRLRSQFGSGYRLSVDCTPRGGEKLFSRILEIFPTVIKTSDAPALELILPDSEGGNAEAVIALLKMMETLCPVADTRSPILSPADTVQGVISPATPNHADLARGKSGIHSWIIRHSHFEDVFLAMVSGKWRNARVVADDTSTPLEGSSRDRVQ